MKKFILTLAVIACTFSIAKAQDNAIGVRFGYGIELSYQRMLHANNRLELDLGLSGFSRDFNLAGVYQWVWDLGVAPGFNWYAGVGATLGLWDKNFGLGINGNIGIEYNFNIPLAISLDWRPGLYYINKADPNFQFQWTGIALGIRYKF